MKRLKSIVLAALAFVVIGSSALPAQPVSAASTGSASLSIAPKKSYVIEPGKTVDDKLTIRNIDRESDLNITLRVIDFTFTDDGGTPKLFLDESAPQTTWSLKPFLTVPKSVTIPKGGSKTLDMKVKIPAGHGAGSYYSAIIYSTGAPDGGNVGLAASGVTLAFVNVPGKVNENLKLEKLGAYNVAKKEYSYWNVNEPQNIAYTLKNNGNVTEAPVGNITLSPLIGSPITIENVNPNGALALIGQSRTYTTCIKLKEQEVDFSGQKTTTKTCDAPGLWPGYYTVSLDLYYGQNGNRTQEITGSAGFWYMPWWFIILIIVILLIIAYFVWRIVSFFRGKTSGTRVKKLSRRKK